MGGPIQNVKVKIKHENGDVDLLTKGEPVRGEVCLYGPTVTPSYFKQPEKTSESIIDGWLHTGDKCELLDNGSFKIIEKISQIIKLSTGDQVVPQNIENLFLQSEYVEQIWIYGDENRDYLIAFIVLTQWSIDRNFKKLDKNAKIKKEIDETRLNEFKFKQLVYEDLLRIAEQEEIQSFEKPRQLYMTKKPFTPERGFLTPALTLRRNNAKILF